MSKEFCPIVSGAKRLAERQGLNADLVECTQEVYCDLKEPCPTKMTEVFNAKIDREQRLLDAKISAQFYSNGDRV